MLIWKWCYDHRFLLTPIRKKGMWSKLTSKVSKKNIDNIMVRAREIIKAPHSKEALNWANKDFFKADNLDLLRLIHLDIWPEIKGFVNFKDPIIDHASLLIKAPSGEATRMHQDSAYWVDREFAPTIFSVWIALEVMTKEKGGLNLLYQNEVPPAQMSKFNKGSTYEHEQINDAEASGGFPILITPAIESELTKSMQLVNLERGEAVAFDSYEPHMTLKNTSGAPRLAMKIAYADRSQKTQKHLYLMKTIELEKQTKL